MEEHNSMKNVSLKWIFIREAYVTRRLLEDPELQKMTTTSATSARQH